jgi:membrane protein
MANKESSVVRRLERQVDRGVSAVGEAVRDAAASAGELAEDLTGRSYRRRYLGYLVHRVREDQLAQVAGSLTYTTLLSLVPFVTNALGLFSAFPIFDQLRDALEEFMLDNLLPPETSDAVIGHVTEFSRKAAGLTAAGVAMLGVTALLLLQTIDRALNAIWRVSRPRPLAQRILVYWAAVSLGPLLIGGGLAITSYAVSSSLGLLPVGQWFTHWLLDVVPVLLTMLAFTLLYIAVPNREVQWKHAAIGGAAAALTFEVMKNLFGIYIAKFPTYHLIYGAFAAIPIFLLWIYLSWLVTLGGALIAATWPLTTWERSEARRLPGQAFVDAMRVLALLDEAREAGGATAARIRAALRAGFGESEDLLDNLRKAGWIARVSGDAAQRWVLVADPAALKVADVYGRFAFDARVLRATGAIGDAPDAWGVDRVAALIDQGLDYPLARAFAGARQPGPTMPA